MYNYNNLIYHLDDISIIFYQNVTCTVGTVVVMISPPGKGHGVAYVADVQTKGRGSKGRVWQAKHSSNIYVSFIIHRPALEVVNLFMSYNIKYKIPCALSIAINVVSRGSHNPPMTYVVFLP